MRRYCAAVAAAAAGLTIGLAPDASAGNGPMPFEPITGSAYGQQTTNWTEPFSFRRAAPSS